jgi:hypothetical protein
MHTTGRPKHCRPARVELNCRLNMPETKALQSSFQISLELARRIGNFLAKKSSRILPQSGWMHYEI